MYKTATLMH